MPVPTSSVTPRRRPLALALVALLALVAAACGNAAGGSLPGDAAATVNGVVIDADEFASIVRFQAANAEPSAEPSTTAATTDETQRQVLTQLIRDEIVTQVADERGIEIDEADVQDQWEVVAEGFEGGEDELRATIEDSGLTEEIVRDSYRAGLRVTALQDQINEEFEVTDTELREAYDAAFDAQYNRRTASHILVETAAEADEVLARLEAGEEFDALAEELSTDTGSAQLGGTLGSNPKGTFVPEFDAAVWENEIGAIVGPVETQFGFHIIRIDSEEVTSFEDAKADLRGQIAGEAAGQRFNEIVQEAIDDAEVVVDARYGTFDPASASVVAPDTLED